MIKIVIQKDAYAYDVQSLTKCFYPEKAIKVVKELYGNEDGDIIKFQLEEESIGISFLRDGEVIAVKEMKDIFGQRDVSWIRRELSLFESRRKQYKNQLKIALYQLLKEVSGRELPWGTLTGVRPTKLPMAYYMAGDSEKDIKENLKKQYLCSEEKIELAMQVAKKEVEILERIDYKNGYSIYIGIPFCPTTCAYCSFTSYPYEKCRKYAEPYLEALFKEIDYCSGAYPEKKLTTIYIGGGTPTALEEELFERLLEKVTTSFSFEHVKEFTVEAGRPDSITYEKLCIMKKYGVTRISINPQTMNQATLDRIGRHHTVEQVKEVFELARMAGHDNINMDLIVGLPGEDIEDVQSTLCEITPLEPDSITIHSLVTKRAARLNRDWDASQEKEPESMDRMLDIGMDYAREHGYEPYYMYRQKNTTGHSKSVNQENIGFARPGKEGIYNILIMEEKQTILALGAGTVTKYVDVDQDRMVRTENVKSLTDYIDRIEEMIDRKRRKMEKDYNLTVTEDVELESVVIDDLEDAIRHGILVSRLASAIARDLGEDKEFQSDIGMAGLMHDIGKMRLSKYLYGRKEKTLLIEEMKYVRMHSRFSYEILNSKNFKENIQKMVLYHHENFDGSGYPYNMKGEEIPWGARILRVCDVFAALVSKRPYREAFDIHTAVELMIDEVKNFDMRVFLSFMRFVNSEEFEEVQELIGDTETIHLRNETFKKAWKKFIF